MQHSWASWISRQQVHLLDLGGQQLLEHGAGAAQHEPVAQLHELIHALHAQLILQEHKKHNQYKC
jgi:hypothetical protein